MHVHAIETGQVRITKSWRKGRGKGIGRLFNTLFDRNFTEWLPIYVWVIEHPEGLLVIDTGISADANKPIWFPPFMPLVQRAARFDITSEQEVGPQLRQLGYSPEDVRWVVLTHLHQDHDGGLHHFPNAEFIVARDEWHVATGLKGRMGGYLNHRWPEWFKPRLVDFEQMPFASFPTHHKLMEDIILVPTPGHSAGHMSVILLEDQLSIMFAGDAAYSDELLIAGTTDGIGPDPLTQQETHAQILAYADANPTVFLPSHDPEAGERLINRTPIPSNQILEPQLS